MKSCLPNLHPAFPQLVYLKRASTFDQLHALFQTGRRGSQDEMQVIRHQNKIMEQIVAPISVFKQFRHNNRCRFFCLK
jgi:hypothetical protein